MKAPDKILFEETFDNQPLFKNQLDLVNQLISTEGSPYHCSKEDVEKYSKAQTRLKTYISQLLSSNVSRSITEDFKSGLLTLLSPRLKGTGNNSEGIVSLIIEGLKEKNSQINNAQVKKPINDEFTNDLLGSSYIAFITSKPLDIDIENMQHSISLRGILFNDLLQQLRDPNKDLKYYRFNFPLDSYGQLLWRGLRRFLLRFIQESWSTSLLETLHNKFALQTETFLELIKIEKPTKKDFELATDEILTLLNQLRYIMIFYASSPIYGMPLVVLNPTEHVKIKIYGLVENESKMLDIIRYPQADALLWRVFVWDKLKSKKYAGEEIKYSDSV